MHLYPNSCVKKVFSFISIFILDKDNANSDQILPQSNKCVEKLLNSTEE